MVAQAELEKEIKTIKKELAKIKRDMVEKDSILTEDDYIALQDYRKEKKEGKLTSHKDLKKELGL